MRRSVVAAPRHPLELAKRATAGLSATYGQRAGASDHQPVGRYIAGAVDILICVTDQGIGLSDDEIGKVFQNTSVASALKPRAARVWGFILSTGLHATMAARSLCKVRRNGVAGFVCAYQSNPPHSSEGLCRREAIQRLNPLHQCLSDPAVLPAPTSIAVSVPVPRYQRLSAARPTA
jgi:hypothetical protein